MQSGKLQIMSGRSNNKARPIVLSIAAWDPSGGAGLAADLKTFEQHKVLGMGILTAITAQTENTFHFFSPLDTHILLQQLLPILKTYSPGYIKIGMCPHALIPDILKAIRNHVPDAFILWDPVLKTSTGYEISTLTREHYKEILSEISLFVPNLPEVQWFENKLNMTIQDISMLTLCLVKGGHSENNKGCDLLYQKGHIIQIFNADSVVPFDKRGTGCIFSSAILSALAYNLDLHNAIQQAKTYITTVLNSHSGKLAYHAS